MNLIITKAIESDLRDILELQKICFQSEAELYPDDNIEPLNQTLESIKSEFNNQIILKGEIQGKIVGSVRAFAAGDSVFLGKLMVHPNLQNKGIGKQMMDEMEKLFPHQKRIEIFTGELSEKNLAFYKKLGYRGVRTVMKSYSLTLIYMEKNL